MNQTPVQNTTTHLSEKESITMNAPTLTAEKIAETTVAAPVAPAASPISKDIQQRVAQIIKEQRANIKDRDDVIHGLWVARVAQQHLLMLGPGGTGKSMIVRDAVSHIDGAKHFEVALDETTDPGQVFGPPDIPAMVKEGKNRRVVTSMLPEATDAFVDEIFNGNSPVLHSLMPIMNERIFHNNGMPSDVPLRSLYAGTNKLNADSDLAAFFDRLHIRFRVDYVRSRTQQTEMIGEAVARMALLGRGTGTSISQSKTMVTIEELDQAHAEALSLSVDDVIMEMFLDLAAELSGQGVVISDRRKVEGMAAVLANAWVRGHEEVKSADLDILANMWWTVQDQIDDVRKTVMAVANPGDKVANDLNADLRGIQSVVTEAINTKADPGRLTRIGVEAIRNADKLLEDAKVARAKLEASGADVTKLDDVTNRTVQFKFEVGRDVFGLTNDNIQDLNKA